MLPGASAGSCPATAARPACGSSWWWWWWWWSEEEERVLPAGLHPASPLVQPCGVQVVRGEVERRSDSVNG